MDNSQLSFHFHPARGWLNDPNGLCCFGGDYHVFFQHAPNNEVPFVEPMVWGHARTRDFLHWEELPIAIPAGDTYDKGGAWSGTAIEKDGVLYCIYASVNVGAGIQTVSVATSRDGIHFEKYAGNPVIDRFPPDGKNDFRDPAVCRLPDGYGLVMASGNNEKHTGNLLLYKSKDLLSWDYVGVLREYAGCRYCECPSFVPFGNDGKYLLAASVCREDGGHWFEVSVGSFDGKTFTPDVVSRFQKGPDEYAGQVFRDTSGRCILISWIPGWEKHRNDAKCVGCLSLPLEITVDGGVMRAYPVEEVRHLLDENDVCVDAYVREEFVRRGEEVYIRLIED